MKKLLLLLIPIAFIGCKSSGDQDSKTRTAKDGNYTYEYVEGDPTSTRIYKLENGLTVYLSDFKNAPRTQVFIPVKAGGKFDPATNTGLAHYLEHMMFKGTDQIGTLDYEAEKVLLDSIEWMFNEYAKLSDSLERKEYYKKIDEISGRAAQLAIPNEYDKIISGLGGKGLNAYTTEDRTVYTVDVPSNELFKFLEVEGERFRTVVNRLFHTELESVYEEKNRSLDNDSWKAYEALYRELFKKHQYGTQTVIGTIEHLKNPSITEIKKYFNTYYRPNNVAICISGDIDYSKTIEVIDQYFGSWEPNEELTEMPVIQEDPITAPRVAEVYGPSAENLSLAFRFPGLASEEYQLLQVTDMILSNSTAGLIDLDLVQQQAVLGAGCSPNAMKDYSMHLFYGMPKEGQTLEEVRDLILAEIEKVKKGEFEDWLIPAVITDFKKSKMKGLESNNSRADDMVMAFTNEIPWEKYISKIEELEKITKQDVMDFANQFYGENYAIVYKRVGEDPNKIRVEKPHITKVPLNREVKSEFHAMITGKESEKLTPVFIDYDKEVGKGELEGGIEVLAAQNKNNGLFSLEYVIKIGKDVDPELPIAVQLMEYLGTDEMSAIDFKKELYKIGCDFSVYAGNDEVYVSLSGLDENLEKGMQLFENLLENAVANQEELDKLVARAMKSRDDSKKNKSAILYQGLMSYSLYGPENSFNNVLSNAELLELNADTLVAKLKNVFNMEHKIRYYGPRKTDELVSALQNNHRLGEMNPTPEPRLFAQLSTEVPKVYWTHFDMVQTEFMSIHKGQDFDAKRVPYSTMFNEYFGGGMNSIVFQEIREAQGLAYSVYSGYSTPARSDRADVIYSYVGTQADKQAEAMNAISELLNNMPESEEAFAVAKQAILSKMESERITGASILYNYEAAQKRNLDYDIRKDIYEQVQNMTLQDVKDFQETYIKDKGFVTILVGNREKIDFEDLKKYGEVQELTIDELFGFESAEKVNVELQ